MVRLLLVSRRQVCAFGTSFCTFQLTFSPLNFSNKTCETRGGIHAEARNESVGTASVWHVSARVVGTEDVATGASVD